MRFLILGGGALGTVVAGSLSRAGNEVTLLVKPAQAAAFQAPEVRITGIAEFTVPVRLVSSANDLGAVDCLIVCVKGRDTDAALAPLRGLDVAVALSLQNGVKKDETLAEVFGRSRVLGALALVSGELKRPGLVTNTAAQGIYVGELDGSPSARSESIAGAILSAGIPAFAVSDIVKREWDKLVLYLSLALVTSVTRLATLPVLSDPDLSAICVRVAMEAAAVAAAEGCALEVTADYLLTLEEWARPIRQKNMVHYMSMTQDLLAGRPTELDSTAGDILDRAARDRVAAPAIETLTGILRGLDRNPSTP
ncbi:MAG TPA: 2-dehydropantoate 2-reductase [Dehalococcoidia bacterium]|nr:2-dehydropantoate 2-reductase [Dehalococcoidia bacterium]